MDESADARFYTAPRLVTHIDDGAIAALTGLYRQVFRPGSVLLDLMSSWVSHLPEDVDYAEVHGLGMNADELAENPRLTSGVVHDLNADPVLPFADGQFDGAAIAVSVQYLVEPVDVFREIGRVLRPDAPLVVSYSNRCFPTKAVALWQALDDREHAELIGLYFRLSGMFGPVQAIDVRPDRQPGDDPLYAVIAHRNRPDERAAS
jgi:SAM-dependent methyltransferase